MKYFIQVSATMTTPTHNQMFVHLASGIVEKDNIEEAEAIASSIYAPFGKYADETIGEYDDLCIDVVPLEDYIKNMESSFGPHGFITSIVRSDDDE